MLHPEEESVKVTLLRFLLTGVQIVPDRSGAPGCHATICAQAHLTPAHSSLSQPNFGNAAKLGVEP